jgi:hypothetical protein
MSAVNFRVLPIPGFWRRPVKRTGYSSLLIAVSVTFAGIHPVPTLGSSCCDWKISPPRRSLLRSRTCSMPMTLQRCHSRVPSGPLADQARLRSRR